MTPRTDKKNASLKGELFSTGYGVMWEFAKTLEEELNHTENMLKEAEETVMRSDIVLRQAERERNEMERIASTGSCLGVMGRDEIRRLLDEIRGCVSDTEKAEHLLHSLLCQFLSSIADGDHRELSERAKLVLSGCDIVYGGGMTG